MEAHVEHLVCLVEDHCLDVGEIDTVAANHVAEAARGSDDDLGFFRQVFELQFDASAAIDWHHKDFGNVLRVVAEVLGDLHAEFTCRTEDQRLDTAL